MSKIRFGIVGCGVIHEWHATVLQNLRDEAELVGVFDIVPEKTVATAKRWGVHAYSTYEEMLKDDAIDAIAIGTPSGLHADQAILAIEHGKHVVVEKPIDVSLEKADKLVAAALASNVVVTAICQNRYGGGVQQLHKWLDEGKLGRLVYGEATVKWFRTQGYYDSGDWRGTWALDGGGALMNQGIHYADQLRWAMGNPKTVIARSATLAHTIEVEDIVTASIVFESGAIGTLTATTCAYPGYSTTLDVYGTDGAVRIADNELVSAWFLNGEKYEGDSLPKAAGAGNATSIGYYLHTCQYRDFLHCIREKKSPWITPQIGRDALELVLGVYQAARTGQPVTFPL